MHMSSLCVSNRSYNVEMLGKNNSLCKRPTKLHQFIKFVGLLPCVATNLLV